MSTLVCNVPPVKVWVHKHALRDYKDQHGVWTPGYWVTVKSIPGRALYFETYLPEYGAMYDKLTIDAFRVYDPDNLAEDGSGPASVSYDMGIEELQFWNAFDYGVVCVEKNLTSNMEVTVRTRGNRTVKGKLLFTLDNYHPHRDEPDLYFSEVPDEHKSHNVVELENGFIGAYPNNRCRMTDPSLSYSELRQPDFKVATRVVDVEYAPDWGRLGECDDYFWETPEEKGSFDHITRMQEKREERLAAEAKIWAPSGDPTEGELRAMETMRVTYKEEQENPEWDPTLGPTE